MNNYRGLIDVKKELLILVILAFPIIYLSVVYDSLPAEVATHFNLSGEADDWTDKQDLYLMFSLICGGMYVFLLVIPFIDPKKQIQKMGNKFFMIKLIISALISILFTAMLYSASVGSTNVDLIPLVLSIFFIGLGNYLQSVKPNYFIGIRTPWTLESKENWNATHRFTGRLWMISFGLILIFYFVIDKDLFYRYYFSAIIVLSLIPVAYSFLFFLRRKNQPN
ncbi:MAG: SdpI family protein [Bacteroidota bacterium]